jgi:hypothetical protein
LWKGQDSDLLTPFIVLVLVVVVVLDFSGAGRARTSTTTTTMKPCGRGSILTF